MRAEITELLDEMLTFKKRKLPPRFYMNHLLDALENCTDKNFPIVITRLLGWLRMSSVDVSLMGGYSFDDENEHIRFQQFFEYCNTLHGVFVLNNNGIIWKDSVNEQEKNEIIEYVFKNYEWKMRYRSRKK
ncbi:MAG: hypothetical protein ACPGSD_01175 [Flavobacteriales bacterium]